MNEQAFTLVFIIGLHAMGLLVFVGCVAGLCVWLLNGNRYFAAAWTGITALFVIVVWVALIAGWTS